MMHRFTVGSSERSEARRSAVVAAVPAAAGAAVVAALAVALAATLGFLPLRRGRRLTRLRAGAGEFVEHDPALVAADLQALLQERDRVGRVAGHAQGVGQVE